MNQSNESVQSPTVSISRLMNVNIPKFNTNRRSSEILSYRSQSKRNYVIRMTHPVTMDEFTRQISCHVLPPGNQSQNRASNLADGFGTPFGFAKRYVFLGDGLYGADGKYWSNFGHLRLHRE